MTKTTFPLQFGAVAIVGVGLIGGSLGMALKERRLAHHVVGVGRDRSRLEYVADVMQRRTQSQDPQTQSHERAGGV